MVKKQNNKTHLYILGGLIALFIAILLLTTALKDVSSSYNFEERIEITDGQTNIKLGSVDIKNNGFMPARVDLTKLQACSFDNNQIQSRVSFSSSDVERGMMFDYYNSIEHYDLSFKEKESLSLYISYYERKPYNENGIIPAKTFDDSDVFTLYVFEVPEDVYSYSYCDMADKTEAIKTIKVVKVIEE